MLCDKRGLPCVTHYTLTCQSSESWRRHAKQHVSFINFKPLELYWTYLLALQTIAPKVSPKRLMSLDHKLKMRWRTLGFVIILCKYELLLEKPLSMNMTEVIWAVSFDSLLEVDPYIDIDDIVGYEFTSWSEDVVGYVSPVFVVEWDMSLFWVLNRFT